MAVLVDPAIVQLQNLNYDAPSCVIFQRSTVIISELVLLYAVIQWVYNSNNLNFNVGVSHLVAGVYMYMYASLV